MTIEGMNHFTVLTDDVPKTVDFYGSVLGLVPGDRPNLNFPGAWLYAQDRAILHIVGGRPAGGAQARRDRPHRLLRPRAGNRRCRA